MLTFLFNSTKLLSRLISLKIIFLNLINIIIIAVYCKSCIVNPIICIKAKNNMVVNFHFCNKPNAYIFDIKFS